METEKERSKWQSRAIWTAVYALSVLAAAQVGRISPTFEMLAQSFDVNFVGFGWFVSLITFASALSGIAAGLLVVAFGLIRSIILGAYLLAALTLLASVSPSFQILLVLRILEGFAYLAVVVAAPTIIAATVRPDQQATALAFWGTFFIAGISLASALGGSIAQELGWRAWFALCGVATASAAVVASRYLPGVPPPMSGEVAFRTTIRQLSKSLWTLSAAFLITTLLSVAILSMLPLYLSDRFSISMTEAGGLTGLIALGSLAGNLFYGRINSRVADRSIYVLSAIGAASASVFAFGAMNLVVAVIGCVAVLFFVGALVAMCFAAVPRLSNGTSQVGAANGMLTQMGGLGALVGPPVIGAIAASFGWPALVYLLATLCLVELVLLSKALK
ncbi:CynX/NimT family MFS transporter [Hoeflea prorocentri]|uniref:MFS transporter n=1 Tax=Hoeflea prorocentri TaxID=1922333 RepID=A0A9X3UNB5_9HYPH|nr:MFS transporter [Hoeflea prorocentri]MCY6383696.1 MFS transporter [Hoeflea prorocentri]MDA5401496.1 MFS transporter [Hoeflea prorocentri]